jgi:hypothetical protein
MLFGGEEFAFNWSNFCKSSDVHNDAATQEQWPFRMRLSLIFASKGKNQQAQFRESNFRDKPSHNLLVAF